MNSIVPFLTFTFWLTFRPANCASSNSQHSQRLLDFSKYDSFIPPSNEEGNVPVQVSLSLEQLLEINSFHQYMKARLLVTQVWKDPRLAWEDKKNTKAAFTQVFPNEVWTPSIILVNSIDTKTLPDTEVMIVSRDGEVTKEFVLISHTSCTIDVTYYPLDQQVCLLKFFQPNLQFQASPLQLSLLKSVNYVHLNNYYRNVEWSVVEAPAYLNVFRTPSNQTETDITFYITVRRKFSHTAYNIIAPNMMVSFALPLILLLSDPGFEFISALILLVFQFIQVAKLGAAMPATSLVVPIISSYYRFVLGEILSVLILVGILATLSKRRGMTPAWMRKIFLRPGFVHLCLGKDKSEDLGKGVEWKDVVLVLNKTFFLIFTLLSLCGAGFYWKNVGFLLDRSINSQESKVIELHL